MKVKKTISIILAALLCLSLTACVQNKASDVPVKDNTTQGNKTTEDNKAPAATSGKIFDKPYKISMLYGDAVGSWPYKEDWYVKKTIEEKTGASLEVILVDSTQLTAKINMIMASGDLPDIISYIGMSLIRRYALEGPYVNIEENIDKLPNYKKWAEKNKASLDKYRVSDSKIYSLPNIGGGITNTRFWFYRNDVFAKYNLTAPKTPEELYEVLKSLKTYEPDSYPFNYREFGNLPPSWGVFQGVYYDESADKFKYGQIEDNFKQVVEFLRKLYAEKLIPPDIYSMDAKAWTDLMVQGKTFITLDYVGRVDGLVESGKKLNPDYSLTYMPPLNGKFPYSPVEYDSMTISKTGRNEEKINNLLKYMDWFYSDEAREVLSWGQEGVTYKTENGKKKFLDINIRPTYGILARGWFGLTDPDAIKSTYSDMCINALNEQPKYELKENPASYLAFNDQETEVSATVGAPINKFANGEISKFVIGEKSMDEWDEFVKSVKDMGLDDFLKIYESAYSRLK